MDFEALREMIQVVNRNKVKRIEVLGNEDSDTMLNELYFGIASGEFDSDISALKHFFETDDEKDNRYRKLRARLVRQVLNTTFFIDVKQAKFNDRQKALYNCYQDSSAAYILIARSATRAAVDVFEQVLEQCLKFEFTELTADITRYLRMYWGRTYGDQQKAEYYAALHRGYEEKRYVEMKAFDYYETLVSYYITKRSPSQAIHEIASKYYIELTSILGVSNTSHFYYYYYQIGIIKFLSNNDCQGAIKIIDEALPKLQARGNSNRGALFTIAVQKLACLTQLRILDNGEGDEIAQYCLSISDSGQFNWFRTQEIYFYYCSYASRYEDALDIYAQAKESPHLSALEGSFRDYWQLLGGYLHLLAAFKKLDVEKVEQIVGSFRYTRFANDFEVLGKDKGGMNIPLVLLPVLYSLVQGNFESSGISIEALDKYRKRYLDNDVNQRSNSFVKMLIAYTKLPYEKAPAEKKIQKELAVLKTLDPQIVGQSFAIEIVPYEDLWAMLREK